MKQPRPTLLILAAGMASRYGSLKQIDRIGPSGERVIDYSVFDAMRAGFGKVVYVIRKSFEEEFKDVIIDVLPKDIETQYVFQEVDIELESKKKISGRTKPWGTGQAILTAAEVIEEPFIVINADDFYGMDSYRLAYNFCADNIYTNGNYALIGYELAKTLSEYGSVSRGICSVHDNGDLISVVERTEIVKNADHIIFRNEENVWQRLNGSEITSMNMFAFTPSIFKPLKELFTRFYEENIDNLSSEFFLPSAVDTLIRIKRANVKVIKTPERWFGLTYKEDKKIVKKKISELVEQGIYPEKLWE